jgi:dienelactone hydrolase
MGTHHRVGILAWRALWLLASTAGAAQAQVQPADAALFLDFDDEGEAIRLQHGAKRITGRFGTALEFTTALQFAEADFVHRLDGIKAATIGGWFFPRRSGEQALLFRGAPETGPNGERFFRRRDDWVNFLLGTDQHGFVLGTINGNGIVPFPLVTLDEAPIDEWSQLVLVKDAEGLQHFYRNGVLVHTDREAAGKPRAWPFRDTAPGEPLRMAMPLGGLIGEAWIFPRSLVPEEIRADFLAKRDKYHPALPAVPTPIRTMNAHPAAGLWKKTPTAKDWPEQRAAIEVEVMKLLGRFPTERVPLEPKSISEEDCGTYLRRKVSVQVERGDRMPAYVLVPKRVLADHRRVPAIVCFYSTNSGAGKDTTVGLSGPVPGTPPEKNRAFAVDMVEAGFVAFAADYLRDGERRKPGQRVYDTSDFYAQFPDWSIHGKDAWDTMRAVDYLQTLPFVDPEAIGMVGHSYGGHSTIFTAAIEPRIRAAFASGPVSDFVHHGLHWAVPKGGRNSQSLPALRPYVLDHTLPLPVTFYEWTALIAPRPLWVNQAVGERRPMEEENFAAVGEVYRTLGAAERIHYAWVAGDHDFPPVAREAAVQWFKRWLATENTAAVAK